MTGVIDPGLFRHRLEVEKEVMTADGIGGFVSQWASQFAVWACIQPVEGHRISRAGTDLAEITHSITIRFRDDITSGMRFVRDGRRFLVESVFDPDETGRYLRCETSHTE